MIDQTQLTESERIELKKIALTKKKNQLEKEIEDIRLQSYGLKGKESAKQLKQYFQD